MQFVDARRGFAHRAHDGVAGRDLALHGMIDRGHDGVRALGVLGEPVVIFRRSDGALVIQFPSGSIPTTSEWACCDIIRVSCLRYFSGIQSLGSMVSPAVIRASNSASWPAAS